MNQTTRGLGLGGFLALTLLLAAILAASGVLPFRQLMARDRAIDLAESKLDALVTENLRLEAQIAALDTDVEVERLAREHFGLVMPGEIGYVAVAPDDLVDPLPEERPALHEEPPWWRRMWDFLTGRDLATDG